eukprot:453907_1
MGQDGSRRYMSFVFKPLGPIIGHNSNNRVLCVIKRVMRCMLCMPLYITQTDITKQRKQNEKMDVKCACTVRVMVMQSESYVSDTKQLQQHRTDNENTMKEWFNL